jgi:hypothetical protein
LASSLESPAAAADLISFLKALPDCRMRRGVRFPQWWMLLVAILAILSGQGSLLGKERFAKRHRKVRWRAARHPCRQAAAGFYLPAAAGSARC